MKAYMIYSRELGVCEGASLVFAHTAKEAKQEGYGNALSYFTNDYTDIAVTLIKDGEHLFEQANPEKLANDMPHVIFAPTSCKACNLWGYKLNEQGYCEDCWNDKESQ